MVESGGLQASKAVMDSFESVKFNPGDTQLTKLHKLAEIRQIAEQSLEVKLTDPDVPDVQKKLINKMMDSIKKSVPFNHDQVDALEASGNPKITVNDIIKQHGLAEPAPVGGDIMSQADAILSGGK
jgi:hypothetical protein